jgi:hypothetical protein
MANHVNAVIHMQGNDTATRRFKQLLAEIERKRSQYDYGDVRPICSVLFGESGPMRHDDERLGGAKWVFAEEAADGQLSVCSGWDPAFGVGKEIFRRLRELDPEVSVWMTFQDEMPNFVGASVWGFADHNIVRADWWEVTDEIEVIDFSEYEQMDEDEAQGYITMEDVDDMQSDSLTVARMCLQKKEYRDFIMEYRGGY